MQGEMAAPEYKLVVCSWALVARALVDLQWQLYQVL